MDTATWAEPNCNYWQIEEASPIIDNYQVSAFSLVLLIEIDDN
jgi:hypothetical protein